MESIEKLKRENQMLKQLVKYGKIYINSYSSDCDGGHSTRGNEFSSVDEVYIWWEGNAEAAGFSISKYPYYPFTWVVVEPDELQLESLTWYTR